MAITMYDTMEQEGAKRFLDSMARNSKSSKNAYAAGLTHFQRFLDTKTHTLQSIIKPLKSNEIDIYILLDEFVSYLIGIKNGNDSSMSVSPRTITSYLAAIRSYLAFNDIEVTQKKFKARVKIPKVVEEDEEAIDASDVREILLSCNNRRLKPYLLTLASGGMRAREATAIRLMDCDFTVSPTRIHLRKEYTKTKRARDVYISDETTKFLKDWIAWKYRSKPKTDTDLVFATRSIVKTVGGLYNKIRLEFNRILAVAKLDQKKEGMQRREITLHSFRRLVKTVTSNQVNQDYSEGFLGHKKSSYYTLKEPEKRQIYATKCMKYLTFLDYTTLVTTGRSIEKQLSEKDLRIKHLEEQMKQIQDRETTIIDQTQKEALEYAKEYADKQIAVAETQANKKIDEAIKALISEFGSQLSEIKGKYNQLVDLGKDFETRAITAEKKLKAIDEPERSEVRERSERTTGE